MTSLPTLTFFAAPRPFVGDFERIQMNAIHSWTCLDPRPNIIVFASDDSAAQACEGLGVTLVRDVPARPSGAPMLDGVIRKAQALATTDLLAYANPDIILLQDFTEALAQATSWFGRLVAIAAPWNVHISERLEGGFDIWSDRMREAKRGGKPSKPGSGADVFVFPSGFFDPVPPIAIGRLGWDNWLLWRAATSRLPSVDLTDAATVIHQDHSGSTHRGSLGPTEDVFAEDVRANLSELGRLERIARRSEIGWALTPEGLVRRQPLGATGARLRVTLRSLRLPFNPVLRRFGLLPDA